MADQIRVLIVDDIQETRDHLTKLLGFETDIEVVGAAASGSEALSLAIRLQPDVVLMDINMPDMDGIAATAMLTATVVRPTPPFGLKIAMIRPSGPSPDAPSPPAA